MQYSYNQQIDAPIEKVFDFIYDEEKIKQWIPELISIEYDSTFNPEQPVGTVFVQRLKEGGRIQKYNGEVMAFKKNHLLELRLWNPGFTVTVIYKLEPIEKNATLFNYSCSAIFNNWFYRVMGKMFSGYMKRMLITQMEKLKSLAEKKAD